MALGTPFGIGAGLAGAAAAALIASPAAAAQPPLRDAPLAASAVTFSTFPASSYDPRREVGEWGCWGCWGGGWGGGWHRGGWRRRGPSAGEVLAGAAIIGGIVAIAASAENNRRNRVRDVVIVERDRWRDDPRNFDDPTLDRRDFDRREAARPPRVGGAGMVRSGTNGLNAAVDQCLARVQRDVRVESVDLVERNPQGWLVAGALFNGSGFQCRIGNDGRIDAIDYGAGGGGLGAASGSQWDDARYADARLSLGSSPAARGMMTIDPNAAVDGDLPEQGDSGAQPLVPLTAERLPAYPGGPIEGEELPPVAQRRGIP